MAKIIYLIRHGESVANKQGIYQGQSIDTGLTELGKKQARAAAGVLTGLKFKTIYTSPLKRTKETAEIIGRQTGLPILENIKLLEINHGSWEGKRPNEFNQTEQKLLNRWQKQPDQIKMIKGEALKDVALRCQKFIQSIPDGQEAAVITHDVIIRVMIIMALKHELKYIWRFALDNGGITTVSFEPNCLISLNQNFHLNRIKSLLNRQAL
jgi:broad specificity phosphatase PhoE